MFEKIVAFMEALAHDTRAHRADFAQLKQGQQDMAATLKSIQDKLATQGTQIDQLAAAKALNEQADLDAIDAAIETNGAKIAAALASQAAGTTEAIAA